MKNKTCIHVDGMKVTQEPPAECAAIVKKIQIFILQKEVFKKKCW